MHDPLRVQIYRAGELTPDLLQAIDHLDEAAFSGLYPEDAGITWSPREWTVTGWVGDELAAAAALVTRQAVVGETPLLLGGVGSVAVLPSLQGRGFGAELMCAAGATLRLDFKVDFGLLLCSEDLFPFYTRLGWRQVSAPLWYARPDGGKRLWHDRAMVLPCQRKDWPAGEIDLRGLPW